MAYESTFEFEEMQEFEKKLIKTAEEEFPKEAERFMKNEARTLKRRMIKKAKTELSGKRFAAEGKSYEERFEAGKTVYEWPDARFNIRTYNPAPHAHLIEYGHRKFDFHGQDTGEYVPGKHIIENTAIAYRSEFTKHVGDKLASQVLKGLSK